MNRPGLSLLGSAVVGLSCAAALDAMGMGSFANHRAWSIVGTSFLGALQALLWPRLLYVRDRGEVLSGQRCAAACGILAGTTAFLLSRAPFGWLDLGGLGAGCPGDLPVIVLPATSVLAVLAAVADLRAKNLARASASAGGP